LDCEQGIHRKAEQEMKIPVNDQRRKSLEQFVQDLLFRAEKKEDFELLVEMLLTMRGANLSANKGCARDSSANEANSRLHLYKMCPDGILWIGFVKGIGKATGILPSLSTEEGSFYFLYDERNGKVVEFLDDGTNRNAGKCS
jgi:hypothetical protein